MNKNLQKNSSISRLKKIGIILMTSLFGFYMIGKCNSDKQNKDIQSENVKEDSIINNSILNNSIDTIVKNLNTVKDYDRLTHIELFYIIEGNKKIVRRAENTRIDSLVKKSELLKKEITAFQKKQFPNIRRKYIEDLNSKLWEHNVEVKCINNSCTKVNFIGGRFASNRNIKEVQEEISSKLHDLRFKRVSYKWIKHDDEYTYYDIASSSDNEY